jgi:hypothetical protein
MPETPAQLAEAGYRIEFGGPGTASPLLGRYWWTCCKGDIVASGEDWATPQGAIADALRALAEDERAEQDRGE